MRHTKLSRLPAKSPELSENTMMFPAISCSDCVAQVVPIAAAFILTVSAGAIFGGVKGTAMVLTCSTVSASISFAFSRSFGRELVLEAAQESPQ